MNYRNRFLSAVLAALLLLCPAAQAEQLNDGSPWVDYVLRENIAQVSERPESPKDDLYLYANYDWAKSSEIAPGTRSESTFTAVSREIRDMALEMLRDESAQGEDAALAGHLFHAFLDWDARNALGVEPLRRTADRIREIQDLDGFTALLCDPKEDLSLLLLQVGPSLNDPETYLLSLSPIQLLLKDPAEYAQRTEMGNRNEAAKRTAAGKMLTRLGYSGEEADQMMDRALALETELAGVMLTTADQISSDYYQRINHEMSTAEACALCTRFPLSALLKGWGFGGAEKCNVPEPAYLEKLDALYTEERLEDLKNYLIVSTALGLMPYLDRESYETNSAMLNTINGSTGAKPDEEAAFELVSSTIFTPLDRAFLARYDASKMKEDITRICRECIAYYRVMLENETWLSAETRAKAVEKLDALTINAVYPEKWRDYSSLSFDGLGYYDCIRAVQAFDRARDNSLPGAKVDHEIWDFEILDTNAYYDASDNSINIIRGILAGGFYREGMTTEELYAGIGTVIGHEISHAFDTNGAQFDAAGKLNNWWKQEDYAAFLGRAQKLIDYYDTMTAFGGYAVRGKNIQTEAIADMAGIKCVLGVLAGKGEVDYRAFFEAFARVWARLNTREFEYYALTQDTHPLHYLRANVTAQQFDEFLEAFGIREGDGMYLNPKDRVLVW